MHICRFHLYYAGVYFLLTNRKPSSSIRHSRLVTFAMYISSWKWGKNKRKNDEYLIKLQERTIPKSNNKQKNHRAIEIHLQNDRITIA